MKEWIKFNEVKRWSVFVKYYGGTFGNELLIKVSDTEYIFFGYPDEKFTMKDTTQLVCVIQE